VLDRIEKAEGAMADYYKAIEKGNESLAKQKKELKDIQSALDKNKKHQSELLAKQSGKKASRDAVV
jgi:conjugal transfer/entry exclusion protein